MRIAVFLAATAVATAAQAEVVHSEPSGFRLRATATTAAPPAEVWRQLGRIERWWKPSHTYSGDADRLRLDLAPGGCFCERWPGGGVEHARVLALMPDRFVRLDGAFGPLQELGAHGVWTITLAPDGAGTKLTADYRVSGAPYMKLDALAAVVDGVMTEQIIRLAATTPVQPAGPVRPGPSATPSAPAASQATPPRPRAVAPNQQDRVNSEF